MPEWVAVSGRLPQPGRVVEAEVDGWLSGPTVARRAVWTGKTWRFRFANGGGFQIKARVLRWRLLAPAAPAEDGR